MGRGVKEARVAFASAENGAQAGPAPAVQQLWEFPESATALGGVGGGGMAKGSGLSRVACRDSMRVPRSGFHFPGVVASGSSMADGAGGTRAYPGRNGERPIEDAVESITTCG